MCFEASCSGTGKTEGIIWKLMCLHLAEIQVYWIYLISDVNSKFHLSYTSTYPPTRMCFWWRLFLVIKGVCTYCLRVFSIHLIANKKKKVEVLTFSEARYEKNKKIYRYIYTSNLSLLYGFFSVNITIGIIAKRNNINN